jgi:predicted MFS family arabinose efflux permease
MWFGACTSSIGTWMQQLAQAWLVFQITGSAFYLGLDSFLAQIPIILFSLLGGVIADRIERRRLLLASQYVQMASAFTLTILFAFGLRQVWPILMLSFVVGTAQAFGGPAYQALVPTLVESKDLPNAIALNSIQFNLARIIGPVLGGLALNKLGAAWCFGLNGLSFVAVIISLFMLKTRFIPARTTESVLTSMKQGIHFILGHSAMGSLIVLAFAMTLLSVPVLVFLPVFAKEVFHRDSGTFTMLLSFSGAGSVVGALVVATLGRMKRQGRAALLMLILLGALISCFSLSRSLVLSCILIFFSGAALMGVFSSISSLVQLVTADQMRGRVMSVYNVAFRGGMPIGSLVVGAISQTLSAPAVLTWNGILLGLLGLYFLFAQRKVAAL